jgi:hypothetical protein
LTLFLTWSVQLIFTILFQHHISKLSRCFWLRKRYIFLVLLQRYTFDARTYERQICCCWLDMYFYRLSSERSFEFRNLRTRYLPIIIQFFCPELVLRDSFNRFTFQYNLPRFTECNTSVQRSFCYPISLVCYSFLLIIFTYLLF